VKAVCQKAQVLVGERGHTLTACFDDGCCAPVWGDYASLQRLLWILLDNAAKYTPAPGTIKVTLTVGGDQATISVEDNGMGISAADLPHIFGRFYRADPSRSQVEGSGLGLSIALWIANVHQASLSAESKESSGSVFRIAIPLSTGQPQGSPVADSLTLAG
jgi:signal transduction histidine kinase